MSKVAQFDIGLNEVVADLTTTVIPRGESGLVISGSEKFIAWRTEDLDDADLSHLLEDEFEYVMFVGGLL